MRARCATVRLRRVATPPITRRAAGRPIRPAGATRGEVPERSIGAVSKTVVPLWGTEGSNPSLSAGGGEVIVTAGRGGSNGPHLRLWKVAQQRLAGENGLTFPVWDYPPGTSSWNKIPQRMACRITQNWCAAPIPVPRGSTSPAMRWPPSISSGTNAMRTGATRSRPETGTWNANFRASPWRAVLDERGLGRIVRRPQSKRCVPRKRGPGHGPGPRGSSDCQLCTKLVLDSVRFPSSSIFIFAALVVSLLPEVFT
jgi:hypothetical protein